jgi:hypothetical protein
MLNGRQYKFMDTQSIRTKLKNTPTVIRLWFASEEVAAMVGAIDQHFHISEDRPVIALLLARLEARDLSPDYFAGELAEMLKLERDKALTIAAEVRRVILEPIKKELSDFGVDISLLNKFEIPTIKNPAPATDAGPKILQDIGSSSTPPPPPGMRPAVPLSTPVPQAPKPSSTNRAATAATSFSATKSPLVSIPAPTGSAMPTPSSPAAAQAQKSTSSQKPSTMSDVGWSKTQSSGPVVKLDVSNLPPKAPAPGAAQAPVPQPSNTPQTPSSASHSEAGSAGTMGEFERLSMMKTGPAAGGAHPAASEPAPVMLHQDTTFHAAEKNAGFTIPKSPTSAEISLAPGKPPAPPKAAVLELGISPGGAAKSPVQSGASHVVHYTNFKPSLSSSPTASSGPRDVSEITAPSSRPVSAPPPAPPIPRPAPPPLPPKPPAPPAPPQPPTTKPKDQQPGNGGVIVKDFT